MGVSNQLEMALINLVVNAIHAMEGGGGILTVSSALRGEDVEIAVGDSGAGIPEAIQATLFEPFVTTKPEGKGTGLGLSTVLMVVERHQRPHRLHHQPAGHDLPHRAPRRPLSAGPCHSHAGRRGTCATRASSLLT